MKILVLNPGSNSLKFEVIETEAGESGDFGSVLVAGSYDGIGNEDSSFSVGQNRSALKKRRCRFGIMDMLQDRSSPGSTTIADAAIGFQR
jgi:acetate kinase